MNLERHATVLWRHREIMIGGLVLGVALAVLAAFQVGWNGGPTLTPRDEQTWSSTSSVLVTQPGFPEGRVTLPTSGRSRPDTGAVQFADPGRFGALATLYSQIAVSDDVRLRLPRGVKPQQIEARPVEGAPGTGVLPVIELTTFAASADAARRLNLSTVAALTGVLQDEQRRNDIADGERVQLVPLRAPAKATLTAGRSHTSSILALLLCLAGAVALAHILEGLRARRGAAAPEPQRPSAVPARAADVTGAGEAQGAPAPAAAASVLRSGSTR